jgi:hypothetical protein
MTPETFDTLMASSHTIFMPSGSATAVQGVFPRVNGSPYYMTKIPDLIGIKDRKYIDHTATHQHRVPGDFMRYAALVQGSDVMDFGPYRFFTDAQRRILYRYDDVVLYATAQYIYSLKSPPIRTSRTRARHAAGKFSNAKAVTVAIRRRSTPTTSSRSHSATKFLTITVGGRHHANLRGHRYRAGTVDAQGYRTIQSSFPARCLVSRPLFA